jgi:hypothetical protein
MHAMYDFYCQSTDANQDAFIKQLESYLKSEEGADVGQWCAVGAASEHPVLTQFMMEHGVLLHAEVRYADDNFGTGALLRACEWGNACFVRWLLIEAFAQYRESRGDVLKALGAKRGLDAALSRRNLACVNVIVDAGVLQMYDPPVGAYHLAAFAMREEFPAAALAIIKRGHLDVLREFDPYDNDSDDEDEKSAVDLKAAMMREGITLKSLLSEAASYGCVEVIRYCIEIKTDIDIPSTTGSGSTALMFAAFGCAFKSCRVALIHVLTV